MASHDPSSATTSLYPLPGGASATRDASGLTYQGSDALGTPVAALNTSTGVVGEQLFAPYGQARYNASAPTNGGLHTSLGFTGQHADTGFPGASGLDYFGARYLDPVVGRFTRADDVYPHLHDPAGLDPYAYVQGMVESATDPSGHVEVDDPAVSAEEEAGAEAMSTLMPNPGADGLTPTFDGGAGDLTVTEGDGTRVTIQGDGELTIVEPNGTTEYVNEDSPEAQQYAPEWSSEGETTANDAENVRVATEDQRALEAHQGQEPGTPPTNPGEGPSTGQAPSTPAGPTSPSVSPSTPGEPAAGSSSSPNFVVTPSGEAITIPDGATGPTNVVNPQGTVTGEAYTGGSGGNGLSLRVTTVRIMDPTGRYPGGYTVYQNEAGQGVNPFTGRTIPNSDEWRHIAIGL